MSPREKMPSVTDYIEPAVERSQVEQARLDRLFPHSDKSGRAIALGDRVNRLEAVTAVVVSAQIDAAPILEASKSYMNDEVNARQSAMAHAQRTSDLLTMATAMIADVKRTQGVRESRTRVIMWAFALLAGVVIVGIVLKTDAATLTGVTVAIAGVAIAIVNGVVGRSAKTAEGEIGSSLRPPK